MRNARLVYVHGSGIHPNRKVLFQAIGSEFVPADPIIRWLHLPNPSYTRKIPSLILSSLFFPKKRKWDFIIGDGPQFLPVVMKKLKQLRPSQKIIPYLAGEAAYFMANGIYGKKTNLLVRVFSQWDAYLCSGKMTEELVKKILPEERHKDIFTIQNFVRDEKVEELSSLQPRLESQNMLFIGNGPSGFRVFYKGLDLMFEAFCQAKRSLPNLSWTIVGEWSEDIKRNFSEKYKISGVNWVGKTNKLDKLVEKSALYFHCSRGDAFPNSVMEAMVSGLPALNSDYTGTREIVKAVEEKLVSPIDPAEIANRIRWYFSLPVEKRREIGEKSRKIILSNYRKENAIKDLKARFQEILERFSMKEITVE
ncbi:MAG: glycosyltransferase [Deltaproteobacteria bacterium]|nr:glycosyltransferase [Deltaproteobacteria bacterium]